MKTLQNDFTTPEQSKRLLGLGIPADSADCYITQNKDNASKLTEIHILKRNYSALLAHYNEMAQKEEMYINITPCWSVGRLIEIFKILCPFGDIIGELIMMKNDIVESFVNELENPNVKWDFSKLEGRL